MKINFFIEKDFLDYSIPLYLNEKIEQFINDSILYNDQ